MRRIIVNASVTLDGVMQAPARPDEDRRGGFAHGGWAVPYNDPAMAPKTDQEEEEQEGSLLLGRRTYEDFFSVWPKRVGNPITDLLNRRRKYVASTTLREPLPWANSTLLPGDAASAVARLKQEPGGDIVVLGSGVLVETLTRHGLVDEYVLSIHPLVLGSGRRFFADGGTYAALQLVGTVTSATGVVIATYRPAGR